MSTPGERKREPFGYAQGKRVPALHKKQDGAQRYSWAFIAWVPWVMAPPARRAAATTTASEIS